MDSLINFYSKSHIENVISINALYLAAEDQDEMVRQFARNSLEKLGELDVIDRKGQLVNKSSDEDIPVSRNNKPDLDIGDIATSVELLVP